MVDPCERSRFVAGFYRLRRTSLEALRTKPIAIRFLSPIMLDRRVHPATVWPARLETTSGVSFMAGYRMEYRPLTCPGAQNWNSVMHPHPVPCEKP